MNRWGIMMAVAMGAGVVAVAPFTVQARTDESALRIEEARRATLGVLQEAPDPKFQTLANRFAIRGSAFHLRDGYLITAHHAVEKDEQGKKVVAPEIMVLTVDFDEVPATLVGVSSFGDVAVYRLSHRGVIARLPAAVFSDEAPQPGDEVFTVGYPLGWGPAMAFGRVGNPNTFLGTADIRLMQLDLSVCNGNSGGGLYDSKGRIVGVMHAVIRTETAQSEQQCSKLAFAVPGLLVQRVVTGLIDGKQPAFSRLGVQLSVVRLDTRWRPMVTGASGPAAEGGIQKGDILVAIEETPISSAAQLKNYLIERTIPGQKVSVRVLRGEVELILHVTLGGA
jgi:serine protease Do